MVLIGQQIIRPSVQEGEARITHRHDKERVSPHPQQREEQRRAEDLTGKEVAAAEAEAELVGRSLAAARRWASWG